MNPVIEKLLEMKKELGSQKAVAESVGVSPAYISEILNGTREPGRTVLEALGFERVVMYVALGDSIDLVDAKLMTIAEYAESMPEAE